MAVGVDAGVVDELPEMGCDMGGAELFDSDAIVNANTNTTAIMAAIIASTLVRLRVSRVEGRIVPLIGWVGRTFPPIGWVGASGCFPAS